MSELLQMGFPQESIKRALYFTQNQGFEIASNWLMEHITDSDFSAPFIIPGTNDTTGQKVTSF